MNIKNILTALTLILGLQVSATAMEPTIVTGNDKTFTLDLADWATQTVEVSITDLFGRILLSEKTNTTRKIYNLKNLDNGTYTIEVRNKTAIMYTKVDVTNNALQSGSTEIVYRPMMSVTKDHIDLNALTQGKTVYVSIYSEGNSIFSLEYVNTPTVTQRFDLSALPAGEYTVSISKGTDVQTQSFVR